MVVEMEMACKSLRSLCVHLQQSGVVIEKAAGRGELEAKEKKVKILEHQRREVRMRLRLRHSP